MIYIRKIRMRVILIAIFSTFLISYCFTVTYKIFLEK